MRLDPITFGARVRRLREVLGLTQAELAERCEVNVGTINRWEKNKTGAPSGDNLQTLAEALETTPRWLLTGSDEESSSPQLDKARRYARSHRLTASEAAFVEGVALSLEYQRREPVDAFFDLILVAYRYHAEAV